MSFEPGLLFTSWGQITDSLLKGGGHNEHAVSGDHRYSELRGYSVITIEAVTLTAAHPCRRLNARATVVEGSSFYDLVPASLHLLFQTKAGLRVRRDGMIVPAREDESFDHDLIVKGLMVGTPVEDIGHPLRMFDEPF